MGPDHEVGLLMVMPRRPATLPSIQLAQRLGRPIQHDDYNPDITARRFMAGVFIRILRRAVPTEESLVAVPARLDAGRWLADCPLGCRGAEMVSVADPWFLCLSCGSGDKWWRVVFPTNRREIEVEVVRRSDVHGWAWNPRETMADLQAETTRLREGE